MSDATAKKLISIIGPMYNEAELVQTFCDEVIACFSAVREHYDFELVLVDDGSTDDTLAQMYKARERYPNEITLVQLSRNFGLEGAVSAGLKTASGDAVIVMDADLQDPPAVALTMVNAWENGADIVVGSRGERPNDSFFKRAGASAFYKLLDSLSGKLKLEPEAANFRLLDRKAVDKLLALPEVNGVFRVVVPFLGMKTEVVSYARDKRFAGETKYRLSAMIRYALDSLTGISVEPLRKVPIACAATFLLSLGFFISLFFASVHWQPALLVCALMSALFSLLFLVLSLMSEYLGQVYTEVKGRPTSVIYQTIPSESARAKAAQKDNV
ncbi:MAG: hypothetical protein CSA53_02615 [Gammaproteobacteria bacterium]|nr:MAG: hypothetical protein CSA53_02615 [Gammaproteobacteria bacterium]